MKVYELIQELAKYPADVDVTVSLSGQYFLFDADGFEQCIVLDSTESFDIDEVGSKSCWCADEVCIKTRP